jgi:hypothetical protein
MHAATKSDCPVQICSISNWASWIIRLPTVLGRSGTFSRILPWRLVARRRLVTRILASCFLFLVVAVAVHDDNDCLWSNVRLVSLSFAFIDFRICKNEWSRTWRMLIFFFRNSGQDENRRTSRMLASKLLSSIAFTLPFALTGWLKTAFSALNDYSERQKLRRLKVPRTPTCGTEIKTRLMTLETLTSGTD